MNKNGINKNTKRIKLISAFSSIIGGNLMRKQKIYIDVTEVKKKLDYIKSKYTYSFEVLDNNNLINQLHKFYKEIKNTQRISFKTKYHIKNEDLIKITNEGKEYGINLRKIRSEYSKVVNGTLPSSSTLRRYLIKNLKYKFKKEGLTHHKSLEISNLYQTHYYIKNLEEFMQKEYLLVFIDESSFCDKHLSKKIWTSDKYPSKVINNGRTESASLLLAITNNLIIEKQFVDTRVNSEIFYNYIVQTINSLKCIDETKDYLDKKNVLFIFDNAKIHLSKGNRKKFCDLPCKFLTLPTYFPKANPVELVFGALKKRVYRKVFSNM